MVTSSSTSGPTYSLTQEGSKKQGEIGPVMSDTTTLKRSPAASSPAAKLRAPCPHVKKKPPSGTQLRRRHARGQTACQGAQCTHRRKSANVQSSSTTSCREAKNGNFDDASKEEDDTGCDTAAGPELSPSRAFAQFPIHSPNGSRARPAGASRRGVRGAAS
jgi:hypothetical protein